MVNIPNTVDCIFIPYTDESEYIMICQIFQQMEDGLFTSPVLQH